MFKKLKAKVTDAKELAKAVRKSIDLDLAHQLTIGDGHTVSATNATYDNLGAAALSEESLISAATATAGTHGWHLISVEYNSAGETTVVRFGCAEHKPPMGFSRALMQSFACLECGCTINNPDYFPIKQLDSEIPSFGSVDDCK